jgi:hypothetical protein
LGIERGARNPTSEKVYSYETSRIYGGGPMRRSRQKKGPVKKKKENKKGVGPLIGWN